MMECAQAFLGRVSFNIFYFGSSEHDDEHSQHSLEIVSLINSNNFDVEQSYLFWNGVCNASYLSYILKLVSHGPP